ncbi:MAG: tungstate transporter permease, partial [Nitrospirota bacterium]
MDSIIEGFRKAFSLILTLDPELLGIIFLSLKVSGFALAIATAAGLPAGTLIGFKKFPGRGVVISTL